MNRYLMNFSYIGKTFRGAQRQVKGVFPRIDDPTTVQGQLEMGLKMLNPNNEPVVYLSSRTDAGVHALNTTCHVDLYRNNGLIYNPQTVTIAMNSYFKKQEVPIRILRTYLVPQDFHSRHNAILRTYLYRIIVCQVNGYKKGATNYFFIPVEELDRAYYICAENFDVELMKEAASLIEGHHDFRTFMAQHLGHEEKETRRVLERLEIMEADSVGYSIFSWPAETIPPDCQYMFLNVYIQSKGFLYKQVRRIIGTLVAVAQHKIPLEEVMTMLQVPSVNSWNPRIQSAPAHGLYLCEVRYSDTDRSRFQESNTVMDEII
ncbi:tRNA pseudouridine synthase-like 1 [Aethina tumida]|uniref:tRNA pseudouridine synthase-like 1 n=1 Tax=Aethina tumida TaxID=116153 RepID=UPI00096B39FC|nr:tRNA pseudouridine synthase-like 1 [Aethina tumida]